MAFIVFWWYLTGIGQPVGTEVLTSGCCILSRLLNINWTNSNLWFWDLCKREIAHAAISRSLFLPSPPCLADKSHPLPARSPPDSHSPHILTQRQDNQGEATQGHPGEGPCDGQHCVGHGGSAQHPKNHGAHQGQLEHGFPSKPATSRGWVTVAGNLSQEQGLK